MQEYLIDNETLPYLNIPSIKTEDFYSSFEEINNTDFTGIEKNLFKKILDLQGHREAVVIVVTDTYFARDPLDSCPRQGNEGRIRELIQIVLIVTEKKGFMPMYRTYGQNVPNRFIMDDIIKDLWMDNCTVILFDRGMLYPVRIQSILIFKFTIIRAKRTSYFKKDH